jgi:hypothetical protein
MTILNYLYLQLRYTTYYTTTTVLLYYYCSNILYDTKTLCSWATPTYDYTILTVLIYYTILTVLIY